MGLGDGRATNVLCGDDSLVMRECHGAGGLLDMALEVAWFL